ncbi:MAG TPA: secretin and TonB N-terminal domain-containing protein [Candidatus Binatia bacterium]|jgi:MSHA biogenesis protein MshL
MRRKSISGAAWTSFFALFCGAALLVQFGCAKTRPSVPAPAPQAAAKPSMPQERPSGLITTEIEERKPPERRYSFSLRDSDIRDVLMAIAKQTSVNIVVDPKVKGTVTVDLQNVTLIEALDTLTDLLDLTYAIRGNIVRVFEPVPETRIFSLQYANLRRTGFSATSAQIGAGGSGLGSGGGTGIASPTAPAGGVVGGVGAAGGSTAGQTVVSTTTETDLWKDIDAGVTKLLSPAGKGVADKQGGNIVVTDLPRYLDRIASYLEKIEGSVQRQVLIEARIVEVSLSGKFQFGLDWSAISKAAALRGATTIAPTRIIGQSLAPAEGSFQIGVTSTDFAALLTVLSTQGEVNVLSSPKLSTLNNQTAVIRSATDEVFFEPRVVTVPTANSVVQTTDVTTRTVTIGVVLAVTPQISSDGSVVLHVRPTVTDSNRKATFKQGASSTSGAFEISVPVVDVREADVVVRAREGQTVVIGGLIQERKTDDESKVPLLGDIPGIGRLFRSTTQERKKTELVVLLSPTVLLGKKIDDITARELDKLNNLKGGSPW